MANKAKKSGIPPYPADMAMIIQSLESFIARTEKEIDELEEEIRDKREVLTDVQNAIDSLRSVPFNPLLTLTHHTTLHKDYGHERINQWRETLIT